MPWRRGGSVPGGCSSRGGGEVLSKVLSLHSRGGGARESRAPRTIHFISLSPPHAAAAQIPLLAKSHTRTDIPREGERGSVAAPRALHARLRVEAPRRVAAAQQVVSRKGHLLAEEVEVVREAEVAA